jgi:hypothetical protein
VAEDYGKFIGHLLAMTGEARLTARAYLDGR